MTVLRDRIAALIEATGPMSVADYMALCLFDPEHGYYTTREPFGAAGDFTTAPEISQMFGELVGVWIKSSWEAIGAPEGVTIAEIGPGRGTMMKDILRTLGRLDPAFLSRARVALVESSPRLAGMQKATLGDAIVEWHASVDTLPNGPLIVVANELFDAIPVRQFVKTAQGWRERVIALDTSRALAFSAGAASADPALLPPGAASQPEGTIVEIAPARTALMATIARRIADQGGCGLFIDYGHGQPGFGDTFQALRRHRSEDVLAFPGEADLTSHVDFAALAAEARAAGLGADVMTQGDFLVGMGLIERAERLGAQATGQTREAIRAAVERLAGPGPGGMGDLFKVLVVAPRQSALPPFRPVA
jgi:SAM-dependent MidA family methyltransferase